MRVGEGTESSGLRSVWGDITRATVPAGNFQVWQYLKKLQLNCWSPPARNTARLRGENPYVESRDLRCGHDCLQTRVFLLFEWRLFFVFVFF